MSLAAIGLIAALSHVQFSSKSLTDPDAFYHARVSQVYWKNGWGALHGDFPWMRYGLWSQYYSDKEYLFHIALAPFVALDDITGAKLFSVCASGFVFVAFFLVCRGLGVARPLVWTALFFCGSFDFLLRLQHCRPHVLNIAVAIMAAWAVQKRWVVGIAILSLVSTLSYSIPLAVPGIVAFHCLAIRIVERRLEWKLCVACLVGLVLGIVTHPHFPNNLIGYYYLIEMFANIAGSKARAIQMGGEVFSRSGQEFLYELHVPLFVIASVGWGVCCGRRTNDAFLCGLGLCVAALFVLAMWSWRFIELFVPLSVLWGAWYWRNVTCPMNWPRSRRVAVTTVVALTLTIAGVRRTMGAAESLEENPFPLFEDIGRWLEYNIEEGEHVFTEGWTEFGELFFYCHKGRYVVGIEPSYFYNFDRDKCDQWMSLASGSATEVEDVIGRVFDSELVVSFNRGWLGRYCEESSRCMLVFRGENCSIFKIAPRMERQSREWRLVRPERGELRVSPSGLVEVLLPEDCADREVCCQSSWNVSGPGRICFSILPEGIISWNGRELGNDRSTTQVTPRDRWIAVESASSNSMVEVRIILPTLSGGPRQARFFCQWLPDDANSATTTPEE